MDLPPASVKGTYVLFFELKTPLMVQAGRLDDGLLPAGFIVYVGSAFGPGGLRARIARHLRQVKRKHWHVDWLTVVQPPLAWFIDTGHGHRECEWSQVLAAQRLATIPIPGFGASDCQNGCRSHLIAFPPHAQPELSLWLK